MLPRCNNVTGGSAAGRPHLVVTEPKTCPGSGKSWKACTPICPASIVVPYVSYSLLPINQTLAVPEFSKCSSIASSVE